MVNSRFWPSPMCNAETTSVERFRAKAWQRLDGDPHVFAFVVVGNLDVTMEGIPRRSSV
jgi:hypothetical protein